MSLDTNFGAKPSFGQRFVSCTKGLCILADVLLISIGCYGFYLGFHTFNVQQELDLVLVLISLYMVLFGLIGLGGELRARVLYDKFGFLGSRLGRACFYIVIGSLATVQGYQTAFCEELVVGAQCPAGFCDPSLGPVQPKCRSDEVCVLNQCVPGCDQSKVTQAKGGGAYFCQSNQNGYANVPALPMNGNGTKASPAIASSKSCASFSNGALTKACNDKSDTCCFYVIAGSTNTQFINQNCSITKDQNSNCVGIGSEGSKALACYSQGNSSPDVCQSQYNHLDPMSRRCCAFVDKEKFTLAAGCVQIIVAFMLLFSYAFVSSGQAGEYKKASHTQPLIDDADAHAHAAEDNGGGIGSGVGTYHADGDGGDALGFGRSSPVVGGSDDGSD